MVEERGEGTPPAMNISNSQSTPYGDKQATPTFSPGGVPPVPGEDCSAWT